MRFALAAVVLLASLAGERAAAEPLRVMTFNVRYGTAPDSENRWELRKAFLLRVMKEFDPDVLGVQEAIREQVDAIGAALPEMACVGVGREADGRGEYSAIYYRRSRFDLMAADTSWLSATPDVPGSHTWGNELPRIVTEARLLDRTNARRIAVFNTHWDHQSQPAREASGALMAERVAARVAAGEPALVTGDFNSAEDNPAILTLVGEGKPLRDTFRVLHKDETAGTFHAFSGEAGAAKIDAVLATADWRVIEAAVVRTAEAGRYPSDHFPVTAIVELEEK